MTITLHHKRSIEWLEFHEAETGETPEAFLKRIVTGIRCADAPWAMTSGPLSDHLFEVPSRRTA